MITEVPLAHQAGKLLMDLINKENQACAVMGHPVTKTTYEFIATVYLPKARLSFSPSQEARRIKITVEAEE